FRLQNLRTASRLSRATRESIRSAAERGKETFVRRVPAQARSRERLERILDAAEAEVGEVGYDAATMQSIAERAGTSIGSVYQFFPNKPALIGAITERYLAAVRSLFSTLLTPATLERPWPNVLDRAIEALFAFSLDAPGFRALWLK